MFSEKDVPQHQELLRHMATLRSGGVVSDDQFDRIFPKSVQKISRTHWTPLCVAELAAQWLTRGPQDLILDVGSGVGKFCFVGALLTQGQYVGVEIQPDLTKLSRIIAKIYKISRVKFVCQDASSLDWSPYQGAYLYNPFSQSFKVSAQKIEAHGAAFESFSKYGAMIFQKLKSQPKGFRAAVYCGYGGERPDTYDIIAVERFGPGFLEVWEKTRP